MADSNRNIDFSKEKEVEVICGTGRKGDKFGTQRFFRVGTVSVDDVLGFLPKYTGTKFQEYFGFEVKMSSQRYSLFDKKGTTCVSCGLNGTHFHLERNHGEASRYHFNLYGENDEGQEIMITKDHIVPRSKGGKDTIDNYQPMCIICNSKKADKMEEEKEEKEEKFFE